jgi:5-methylcytosine-specific restriction endonuclease McrA
MLSDCRHCGREFETRRTDKKYCSVGCQQRHGARVPCECGQRKSRGNKWCRGCMKGKEYKIKSRQCAVCGVKFKPKNDKAKYCCLVCCHKGVTAKAHARHGIASVDEPRRRRQARRRRASQNRWRKLACVGGTLEAGRWKRIGERDGWVCWLCSDEVDPSAPLNSKYAPTADHVVPLDQGGSDGDDNLRLAHRSCNSRRRERAHIVSLGIGGVYGGHGAGAETGAS